MNLKFEGVQPFTISNEDAILECKGCQFDIIDYVINYQKSENLLVMTIMLKTHWETPKDVIADLLISMAKNSIACVIEGWSKPTTFDPQTYLKNGKWIAEITPGVYLSY